MHACVRIAYESLVSAGLLKCKQSCKQSPTRHKRSRSCTPGPISLSSLQFSDGSVLAGSDSTAALLVSAMKKRIDASVPAEVDAKEFSQQSGQSSTVGENDGASGTRDCAVTPWNRLQTICRFTRSRVAALFAGDKLPLPVLMDKIQADLMKPAFTGLEATCVRGPRLGAGLRPGGLCDSRLK